MFWIVRPTSLAWEVKKMSPGRHVIPSPSTDRMNVASTARRSLNFGWDDLKNTHSTINPCLYICMYLKNTHSIINPVFHKKKFLVSTPCRRNHASFPGKGSPISAQIPISERKLLSMRSTKQIICTKIWKVTLLLTDWQKVRTKAYILGNQSFETQGSFSCVSSLLPKRTQKAFL